MPASAFRHVLGTDPLISEYQVRQTATGADVLVVGAPDVPAIAAALVGSLSGFGLVRAAVDVRAVERIPRNEATGKLRRFVPL